MNLYGRVYEKYTISKLLRLKTFFFTCKFPFIIRNLNKFYNTGCKVFGKSNVHKLIQLFYGDIFLAGETIGELERCLRELKSEDLITIADYAREFLSKEEESKEIDNIIAKYKESIDVSAKIDQNNCIAIKISSFGDVEMLKKVNAYQRILIIIEDALIKDRTSEDIIEKLNNDKLNNETKLTKKDIEHFISSKNTVENFDFNIFEVFLNDKKGREISEIQKLFNLSNEELKSIVYFFVKLDGRLRTVLDRAKMKDCLMMVDAEQSYLRYISDSIVAYYFKLYNTDKCILANTLQAYLKSEPEQLEKWYNFCSEKKLRLGIKLVRGAYMNEECKIAYHKGVEAPICSSIEKTNDNYNNSLNFIFENYRQGDKFCIATHNLDSIALAGNYIKKKGGNENIFCAQLMGIADNVTGYCKMHNIKNSKYVPFGNFDILIPYLMRRAEESTMMEKLNAQNQLLDEELRLRMVSLFRTRRTVANTYYHH